MPTSLAAAVIQLLEGVDELLGTGLHEFLAHQASEARGRDAVHHLAHEGPEHLLVLVPQTLHTGSHCALDKTIENAVYQWFISSLSRQHQGKALHSTPTLNYPLITIVLT